MNKKPKLLYLMAFILSVFILFALMAIDILMESRKKRSDDHYREFRKAFKYKHERPDEAPVPMFPDDLSEPQESINCIEPL